MATRRRVVAGGGGRRTIAGKGATSGVVLDDRPLDVQSTRAGKRLIVTLPYEVCIVNADTMEVEKTTELSVAAPSVFEAEGDGALWIGGSHLHRGSLFAVGVTKAGTKLGGFVDRVTIVRPRLLCGAGPHGEVLWDTSQEAVVHRRKASEHAVLGLVASADGRAVWIDGASHAWVIDPDHAQGYMKLKFKATSEGDHDGEGISALGMSRGGRCLFAANDGGVAWTNRALRVVAERFPADKPGRPLKIDGDDRWVYVLRRGNVLQRFLIEQPPQSPDGGETPEYPEAQSLRLERATSTFAVLPAGKLSFGGPQSDGQLGRLWVNNSDDLAWEALRLGRRLIVGADDADGDNAPRKPDFTQVRSKLSGPPIADIPVDDVVAAARPFWATRGLGQPLERPTAALEADDVLAADALLLPAMLRLHEGTARPGLVVWPGAAPGRAVEQSILLAWGDDPRQWIVLDTPSIRAQGWSRRGVFPLEVALAAAPPSVAGSRPRLPKRWADPELFAALAKECKKQLKVLW